MFLALIRFIIFEVPCLILSGITSIFFDKEEVVGTELKVRRIRKPINKEAILRNYLERCYKQVHQEQKGNDEKE